MKIGNFRLGFPSSPEIHFDWISLLDSFRKYAKSNYTVLEIGASNISRTKGLVKHCRKVVGAELFSERIPRNFANVTYVQADWQELTKYFPKKSIDLVISNQVIEHVEDDHKALNELYEVMKPGSVALICTPNRTRLAQHIFDKIKGKERDFPWYDHAREYVEDEIITLIKKSKFKKFKIKSVVFGMHAGPLYFYSETVPNIFRKHATYLEFHLFK